VQGYLKHYYIGELLSEKNNVISKIQKFKPYEQMVLLCSRYDLKEDEKEYIQKLIFSFEIDWSNFLGTVLYNRVNGIVYNNIKQFEKVPVYVIYSLKIVYSEQEVRTKLHQEEIFKINDILDQEKIKFAFLKGSVLNSVFYKKGERISNDTDIMVSVEDLDRVVNILKGEGYIQGRFENGEIIPAMKKEIIFARLNTYEIVPLIKKINERYFPVHELDINFRLGNDDVKGLSVEMLDNTFILKNEGKGVRTMSLENFLLFLCVHHYREATMIYKIVTGDDFTLYKYMDVHFFITQ